MHAHHTWTTHSTSAQEATHDWYVVDAAGQTLGRLATRLSQVLQGKHKAAYTPHTDTGDFVVVVNAEKIVLSGKKLDQKQYHRYSGFKGGLTSVTARKQLQDHPERVLEAAVGGMVPRNRLGRQMLTKLKVYAGATHPHLAQEPKPFPEYV
ncbi:MAG: 50S ribosomal protein L13 [Myxococcales bacterium]|nr:50S ribosomal protein L13 [Myxococcales bacterium]